MSLDGFLKRVDAAINALSMDGCSEPGCNKPVSKKGHKYCYEHWKANQDKTKLNPTPVLSSNYQLLSSSGLSESLGLNKNEIHRVLAELGWIQKYEGGWLLTEQGLMFGGVQKKHPNANTPYVMWSKDVLTNRILIDSIAAIKLESPVVIDGGFRDRFSSGTNYRTTDGHWVRSRAELVIDNWLYMAGLLHAYERKLPIEEEVYCDFYLPTGNVYIEFWGYENDGEYLARKRVKQELYQKYQLNLIELTDEHIRNLDDFLPRFLLSYKIVVS